MRGSNLSLSLIQKATSRRLSWRYRGEGGRGRREEGGEEEGGRGRREEGGEKGRRGVGEGEGKRGEGSERRKEGRRDD